MQPVVHPLPLSCFFTYGPTLLLVIPKEPASFPHSTYTLTVPPRLLRHLQRPVVPVYTQLHSSGGQQGLAAYILSNGCRPQALANTECPTLTESYTCSSKYNRPTCTG